MSDIVRRVRAQFPTIQITMISILVALALQELLDRLPTVDALWTPSWLAVRVWCQAAVAFTIILKMWTGFVFAATTRERVPRPIDLLGPLGLLVFVDAQIASIDAEHALRWLYVLGIGSLVAAVFIAGQRLDGAAPDAAGRADGPALANRLDPAAVETWIGVAALVFAVLHQTIEFGERGLLAVCGALLLVEAVTATGLLLLWHALRRAEDALLAAPGDARDPP